MPKSDKGYGSAPRISRRLKTAIDALLDGSATVDGAAVPIRTRKAAADLVGMDHGAFSRALQKPHVHEYIRKETLGRLGTVGLAKAARVLDELLESKSDAVRKDVAIHLQQLAGVAPPGAQQGGGRVVFEFAFKHVKELPEVTSGVTIDGTGEVVRTLARNPDEPGPPKRVTK